MTTTYAIEPTGSGRWFQVIEYDDEALTRELVYEGTQAEAEQYVREHETETED